MLDQKTVREFINELGSNSPVPGVEVLQHLQHL